LLYICLTSLVVLFGVEKGIEKVSKFMMPVLVVMVIFIAVYSMFMPGAMDGVKYYLTPDFSKFSITTVLAAMGQLFYSMSLAMGIMITYGSYMRKDVNLESSVKQIELFDTGIAFFSGLMIIPAVFAFSGGNESALGKGPSLMFVTLPKVFESMPAGSVIGAIFFIMVLLAALTSSISLMETIVSIFMDKFKISRKKACIAVILLSVILGLLSTFGYSIWKEVKIIGLQFLDFFDFISNSVIMPVVAFLTCILIGHIVKPKSLIEEIEQGGKFKRKTLFTIVIKYIAPVCIVAILIFSVLEGLGIIKV
jgi:NSS family neurotransmitter:Na+ symporter